MPKGNPKRDGHGLRAAGRLWARNQFFDFWFNRAALPPRRFSFSPTPHHFCPATMSLAAFGAKHVAKG